MKLTNGIMAITTTIDEPDNPQKDRLPGVEPYLGFLVVGRDHQEDDRRNEGEVGKARGGIVAKAGLGSFFGHTISFCGWGLD